VLFRSILVDEWQDTNPAQLELLKLLIGSGNEGDSASFWVAGDDAQAIYGFTGASVGNILAFQDMFPESSQMFLTLNYRSTPQILSACHNLIRQNERQIQKDLKTHNPSGEDVIVLESSSEETEALSLVNEIKDLVERRGYKHKDMAVLYRCNFQSRVVEEAFLQHKIPYHVQNGLSFYDRHEVRGLLDYLRVINNPNSETADEALLRILNCPNRYIGRTFNLALKDFADENVISMFEGLKAMRIDVPYLRKNVKSFICIMEPLIEEADKLEPSETITLLRSALDWDRYVTDDDIPGPDDTKIQNIEQLHMAASRFKDIGSFLQYTETFQDQGVSGNPEGVSLMTVHKAKGLEFPIIFVIGMVEGIMPTRKDANIEEERRICFVAMSRAMHLLYLSHSLTYLGQPAKKSVFLDEIRSVKEEPMRF